MRKKFIYIALVPLLIVSVVAYLFIDRWIESGLESLGEEVIGAKVEIDDLRVSLFPLAIDFRRLQVANPKNPWKNIFETGKLRAALDLGQLLRGKYIVETVELNDLVLATRRTTDGSLPMKPVDESSTPSVIRQARDAIAREVGRAAVFDLQKLRSGLKIDSLLDIHALKTVRHIDTLKLRLEQAQREWQAILADIEASKQQVIEIEANIRAINPNELKTIESIAAAVTNVNSAYKRINEVKEIFKDRRASVTNHIGAISSSVDIIDDLAKEDFKQLKNLARLPDMSMQGIANLLLGKPLLSEVDYYLGWVVYVRNTIPRYIPQPDYKKPKRFEGQDIHFPSERGYPKFWIKRVLVSGGTDRAQDPEYFYARGEALHITANQRITGHPLTISLDATKGGTTSLTIEADFDRRKDEPLDRYSVRTSGLSLGDFELGRSDFLPSRIAGSTAAIHADVEMRGNRFDSKLNFAFRNLQVTYERSPENDVERIVRDVLQGVSGFDATLRLWNTKGAVDIALTTDLDNQIAERTRRVIGDEIRQLQNEIRVTMNRRIAEKRRELDRLFTQAKEEAIARLRSYENYIDERLALFEGKKKALEARIEEEKRTQTDAARKKLEDALRGLIRRQ